VTQTKEEDGRKLKRRVLGTDRPDAEDLLLSDSYIVEISTEQEGLGPLFVVIDMRYVRRSKAKYGYVQR
jgi:hypothetical protein